MKHSFTDIHHHLLYGVDDGPADARQMARMLRQAAGEGIARIIATPHIAPGIKPFSAQQLQTLVDQANQICARLQLSLRVDLGCEILYTQQTPRFLSENRIPTLAGTDRVLVEFSPDVRASQLQHAVEQILGAGYLPVLAHMERYRCLSTNFRFARHLHRSYDVLYQVNTHSILGGGFFRRRFVSRLLREGLADAVATDAHNTSSRPAHMAQAWRFLCEAYGEDYACRLTGGALLDEH